jgi:hypothetical protein
MEPLDVQFLIACHESVVRRRPLLAELAALLGVGSEELFYLWAERRCEQHGCFPGAEWTYFFHGYECDLRHTKDGRFLRIDFGPHGNTNTFTAWGVAQFVMTSRSPWSEYGDLKSYLADRPPPYDEHSASLERAGTLCDRLESAGLLEPADRELLAFAERHTTLNPEGIPTLRLPQGTSDRKQFDISVAQRKLITEGGRRVLSEVDGETSKELGMGKPSRSEFFTARMRDSRQYESRPGFSTMQSFEYLGRVDKSGGFCAG